MPFTVGDRSGIFFIAVVRRDMFWFMLCSGRHYQPEMSEVAELLKAWKEE